MDFERGLNAAVAKLRQALDDSADRPLYIETVARKGYRFIAPVVAQTTTAPESPAPVVQAEPEAIRRRTLVAWIAAGLAVAGLTISIRIWHTGRAGADQPLVQLDLDIGREVSQPVISPDGLRIAFRTEGGLAMRRLNETRITSLADTEGSEFPFFSPDGRWLGFFAGRKLMKIPIEGGAPVKLCDAPLGGGATHRSNGEGATFRRFAGRRLGTGLR